MCPRASVYFSFPHLVLVFIVHCKVLDILTRPSGRDTLVTFCFSVLLRALVISPMSGKRQKFPTKRGRASEDPTRLSMSRGSLTKVLSIGSTPYARTALLSKKRVSMTPLNFSARLLRLRDGELFANHLV